MKYLTLAMAALLLLSISVSAQWDIDPGAPDSIIIDRVAVPLGTTSVNVQILAVTDDSVAAYNIPLRWTPDGIGVHANVGYGWPLTCWALLFDSAYTDQQHLDILGILDLGEPGQDTCYLFTDGVRLHIMTLHFALPPGLPPMTIDIDSTHDNLNGSLYFGSWDGIHGWVPQFKRGIIVVGDPQSIGEFTKPTSYILTQNYPNPFNPSTQIEFALPKSGPVTLKIYDILGRHVKRLIDENLNSGHYSIIWDGTNDNMEGVPSGAYFYKLTAGDFMLTKKMLLIR